MRKWLLAALVLADCSRPLQRFDGKSVPQGLSYSTAELTFTRGLAIDDSLPALQGTASLFSVTPQLPLGLDIDSSNGTLRGTPQSVSPQRAYTVTAQNELGATSVSLLITVEEAAPSALVYGAADSIYVVGVRIADNEPGHGLGRPDTYSVAPALPPGLDLDRETGVLFGVPLRAAAAADYVVTAENARGTTSTSVRISVHDAPPELLYVGAPFRFVVEEPASSGLPINLGGPFQSCAREGALPDGLTVITNTCEIAGFPTVDTGGAVIDVQIRVTYAHGDVLVPLAIEVADKLRLLPASGGTPPYRLEKVGAPGLFDPLTAIFTGNNVPGIATLRAIDARGRVAVSAVRNQRVLVDGHINAAAVAGNALYVGGSFNRVNPYSAPRLLALRASDLVPDFAFDPGIGADGTINAMVASTTALYIGGVFRHYNGAAVRALAKVDLASGQLDTQFSCLLGLAHTSTVRVSALALEGNELYVGGDFDSYRGETQADLIKLDATTGARVTAFQPGQNHSGIAALALAGNELLIGGKGMARVSKVTGAQTNPNVGLPTDVVQTLLAHGGFAYAGGSFNNFAAGTVDRLARFALSSTVTDATFNPLSAYAGDVQALAVKDDFLYAGGTMINGANVGDLIRVSLSTGLRDNAYGTVTGVGSSAIKGLKSVHGAAVAEGIVKVNYTDGLPVPGPNAGAGFAPSDPVAAASVNAIVGTGSRLFTGGEFLAYGGTPATTLPRSTSRRARASAPRSMP